MDAALIREREAFKRRALAVPIATDKKAKTKDAKSSLSDGDRRRAAKAREVGAQSQSAKAKLDLQRLKALDGSSSQYKFGVLAKIVRHMKTRHLQGDDHPLNLEDILDETNQLDVPSKTKLWLSTEALASNPKILAHSGGTYTFKAPYDITSRKGLIRLLKSHDLKGLGGIFLEDIQESLAKCDKIIAQLKADQKIIEVTRPVDKKQIIFYHDHMADFHVDEDFQKLWRSVAVDQVEDAKIEEYLEHHGMSAMQDEGLRKVAQPRLRKKPARKTTGTMKDNQHMAGVLKTYSLEATS